MRRIPQFSRLTLVALTGLIVIGLRVPVCAQSDVAHATERLPTALSYSEALLRIDRTPTVQTLASAASSLRRATREISGLASDLELAGEAGPRLGDASRLQARIELAQGFALASLGRARKATAEARASTFDAEREALRTLRRIEAANAWLDTYGAQRTLSAAQAESALASALVGQAGRLFSLGEATVADVADTEAYAAEAQLAVLAAEGEWTEARLRLSSALSATAEMLDAAGEPPELSPPTAADARALIAHLERMPAVTAAERQRQAVTARSRELDAQHASTLRVGVALDHSDPAVWAPLAVLGVTLPWRGRSARERAELEADAQLIEAERSQSMIDAGLQVERALHEIQHSGLVLQQLDAQVVPAFERGAAARGRLFAAAEITAYELITTRRALLSQRVRRERARVQWLRALASFHELRAATESRQP